MPLTDEEDIFGDYEAVPTDLAIGDDDNDTDYEDISQVAAEDDSHHPDEEARVKSVKVRDVSPNSRPMTIRIADFVFSAAHPS